MTLFQQIQAFLGSMLLGMLFTFFWSIFNRAFYKYQGKWVRLPIEAIFLSLLALGYFKFLLFVCGGILNLHYVLALIIGLAIYQRFYASYINIYHEELIIKIHKFLMPLKKQCDILNLKYKKFKVARKDAKQKKKQNKKNNT